MCSALTLGEHDPTQSHQHVEAGHERRVRRFLQVRRDVGTLGKVLLRVGDLRVGTKRGRGTVRVVIARIGQTQSDAAMVESYEPAGQIFQTRTRVATAHLARNVAQEAADRANGADKVHPGGRRGQRREEETNENCVVRCTSRHMYFACANCGDLDVTGKERKGYSRAAAARLPSPSVSREATASSRALEDSPL